MSALPPNQQDPPDTGSVSDDRSARDSVDDIVRQASTLSADDRLAFVQGKCAGDNLLLAQALDKLRASSPQWWDMSIESRVFERTGAVHERTGEMIGSYRVIRNLGTGGMGEVLLAERDDQQFRQQVAIKLVKRGTLSPTVQARLKMERQILATLDHPNIARLLDGGTDRDGTPYIVMEYIEGEPLDSYCDRNKLSIDARIALFRTICSAVHSAHQNLIVHRDLKPSNILVTADGTPKLLDFGIAKIIDDRSLLHTMAVTQIDVRVMTPEHASPEQVRGDLITTASDVYCLGVLLFELLSGARPYAITSQRLSEIERAICDEEPQTLRMSLSRRDSTAIERLCEQRATSPAKLRRVLGSDLSNIVMTALRKEPERRYASAEQFSADLGRYLAGMPVTASKDSWQYRTQKFVRRHHWGVAIGSLAIVGVVGFAVVTLVQAQRIAREQARAEYVSSFLIDMFENADPTHSRGKDITVREILDVGARNIETRLNEQPETRARLQATVGRVYMGLGQFEDAERLLRQSLAERLRLYGNKHAETADAMHRLGDTLLSRNRFPEATPLLESALAIYRDKYGDNSVQVAIALRDLGIALNHQQQPALGEQYMRESLKIFELQSTSDATRRPAVHAETSETLNRLGQLVETQGHYADAADLFRRSVAITEQWLGRDHPSFAFNLHNLGMALQKQGLLEEAQPKLRESLAIYRKIFGAEHPETLAAMANYGMFLHRKGDIDSAERTFREVLTLNRKVRGEQDSFVGYDHVNLGLLLYDKGQFVEAEAEFRAALSIYAKSLPTNHGFNGSARRSLGIALVALGRGREAEKELQTALQIFSAGLAPTSPQVLYTRATLGKALAEQQRYQEAEPLLRDNYIALLSAQGATHPAVVRLHGWIEEFYADWGAPERASEFFASTQALQAQ
jgi:serine/threonine protein kinase/uncharacterized protein HemY